MQTPSWSPRHGLFADAMVQALNVSLQSAQHSASHQSSTVLHVAELDPRHVALLSETRPTPPLKIVSTGRSLLHPTAWPRAAHTPRSRRPLQAHAPHQRPIMI